MANKKISSVNLLPEVLKTNKNAKFLASTIDQFIQPAQLERLDTYVGSTNTPTYNSTADVYISGGNPYEFDPALIINDSLGNIKDSQGYDDLINEIASKGGFTNNLDRLFRSKVYSYNSHVDWDKLVNYQYYYWMPDGLEILVLDYYDLDVDAEIIGKANYTATIGDRSFELSNGMLISFSGSNVDDKYFDKQFFVEGVGTAIVLVPLEKLLVSENFLSPYPDGFGASDFDTLPFDNDRELPNTYQEYVTINKASLDLNPWTRYNRWVHQDVIKLSAEINGVQPQYPVERRAQRPIIEFKANIKMFNFGTVGLEPIDIFDTKTTDAFLTIEGSTTPVYVDGIELEEGLRIIFNADEHDDIKGKIYNVHFVDIQGVRTLTLQPSYDHTPIEGNTIAVLLGNEYNGTDWWYTGNQWQFAQQRTALNQAPLFDLFDGNGHSYSDKEFYLSNFTGNKIFSYAVGTGTDDPYLKFPLSYRNVNAIGAILFENNLVTDTIVVSQVGSPTYEILSNVAYCRINGVYENAWVESIDYEMPLLSSTSTGITSYYEEPLSLTNNPLNGTVSEFTISELDEHVRSMIKRVPGYSTSIINAGNLRDLPEYSRYGLKLISNANPISFAQMFIGKKENDLVGAIIKSGEQYNQFKLSFLNSLISVSDQIDPVDAVDQILTELNKNKVSSNPYYYSDMVAYGNSEVIRTWTVSNPNNVSYPLNSEFDLTLLSNRSVLMYLNGEQLTYGIDYTFNVDTSNVDILIELSVDDVLIMRDYADTTGCYVPPTPTKLGLYPKFAPLKYVDDTYVLPQAVIQGHDGSIMLAFNDYRDDIILELEKRIYNNIKSNYRSDLFDINTVLPGAFRTTEYSQSEVNEILEADFARWAAKYSIDYITNNTFNSPESKTWNMNGCINTDVELEFTGSWRAVFKNLYDTDRPHTHPWEMLGLSNMPAWWEDTYGPAPYTSGNLILWQDLADGKINGVVNLTYARPGLLDIIPVDEDGNLISPETLVSNLSDTVSREPWANWVFGDIGPSETAWRRSSLWPFAVQRLLALTKPATYSSLMYDVSRVTKNIAGQWTYGDNETFFRLSNLYINGENNVLTSGYSAMVSEVGQQRTSNYLVELREYLEYATYNLFFKVGGFVDQDTLQVIIDAYEPTSTSPGSVLPSQNYRLRLNVSNPIKTVGVSGIVVQKSGAEYIVKGYDTKHPYFPIFKPTRNLNTPSVTIGGKTEKYVVWEASGSAGATGLSASDTTTANSAATGNFYQKGQYVLYGTTFYVVTVAHQAGATFNTNYFRAVPHLPTTGGATVQNAGGFSPSVTHIPYGTTYSNIQDVYDLIIGYGQWLVSQGFVFDTYNAELNSVVDWSMTAKEFLFWTTQKWSNGSVITLSPFADSLVYKASNSVVDNLFNGFYEYSILRADGTPFPKEGLSVDRVDGVCTISTLPNTDGIYFARLNLVQKEHAMVFDNKTIFGDIIFNPETGSRQHRVKLVGFRTANWDGDYSIPGFVYDTAVVNDWAPNTDYIAGDVVRFGGKYYAAIKSLDGSTTFDFTKWDILNKKPTPGLLPNFDYKISQFEDFYSLDSDNFDEGQQKMSQHLTGYTPRVYLNNVFSDPVAQYKFYQGFIKEKGTQNSISKLSKASLQTLKGDITYKEEWAFRVGNYGSFATHSELEVPLVEGTFLENPQVINFVDVEPAASARNLIHYTVPGDLTIKPTEYSPASTFATTSTEDAMVLLHAGYVRVDDVTATAYNENSLLDIANSNELKDGDTIWLGFKQDGSWDVYRYTYYPVGVVGVFVSAPYSTLTFTTQNPHGLKDGQLIGISQLNAQVDGIYFVKEVLNSTQFAVSSDKASLENAPLPVPGQLYVFDSARIADFNSLPSDKKLFRLPYGTKFWVDQNGEDGWEVYEKINNYDSTSYFAPPIPASTALGTSLSRRKGDNIIVVGAPNYRRGTRYGFVYVYKENSDKSLTNIIRYGYTPTYTSQTGLGSNVVYDNMPFGTSEYGLVFASAPLANTVKISQLDSRLLSEGVNTYISNPNPSSSGFGSSIYVEANTSTKIVLIASNSAVYSYTVADANGSIVVSSPTTLVSGASGYAISGTDDASLIAVGSPSYSTGTGVVTIFNKSLTVASTIVSPVAAGRFGQSVSMSPAGEYLFVSAPLVNNDDGSLGKVFVYKNYNGNFTLEQTLENPVAGLGMNFGYAIDVNETNDTIAISARGINHTFPTTFDKGATIFDGGITNIKGTEVNSGAVYVYYRQTTRFVLSQELTDIFVATNPGTDYGISLTVDDNSIVVGCPSTDNTALKGAFFKFDKVDVSTHSWSKIRYQENLVDPKTIQRVSLINTLDDEVIEYLDVIDPVKGKVPGIAEQELTYKLISDPAVYSIGVAGVNVDTTKNWLDDKVGELWWDLSTAKYIWYEQSDLEYRRNNWGSLFPGATIDVYEWVGSQLLPSEWASQADTPKGLSQGVSGQPRFADNSVISVKQVYDNITNSFSNVYYYWVKNKVTVPNAKDRRMSSYEVASLIADPTANGLKFAAAIAKDALFLSNIGPMLIDDKISLNIVQDLSTESIAPPKHTEWLLLQENSDISMPTDFLEKKLVDSLLGHDKNGNIVPDRSISDRVRYGIGVRPQQSLFKNRLEALRNVIEFSNNVLIDTPVTGHYSFKNLNAQEEIPDRYLGLYDQVVEDNSALEVVSTASFAQAIINCRVNADGEVTQTTIVEPGFGYGTLNPVYSSTGTVLGYQGPAFTEISYETTMDGGKTTFDFYTDKLYPGSEVDGLKYVNDPTSNESGYPTTMADARPEDVYGRDLNIFTMVDDLGQVTATNITVGGKGYASSFKLIARPQTIVVQSDSTYNGKWTSFEFDYKTYSWNRDHTQAYNTQLYWDYVDWASADYNKYQIYDYVIGSPYELPELETTEGQYVKINNGGDGRYIVLKKLEAGTRGTYGNGYDIVYSQNGTIQISDGIWDLANSGLGWDYINTYDQTLWDQAPDIELQYILAALKNDIFINELKVNWNLLFFKAVKYAMTEQKTLDWAFKTSFINVVNNAGELTQPPVYKLQDSAHYENYISEVKPYHTEIRNFTTKYSVTEPSNTDIIEVNTTTAITIKFDRVSDVGEVGEHTVTDLFIARGYDEEFLLSWVPTHDKTKMVVKVNGLLALSGDFTIHYYSEPYNGYKKQFAKLVFLREIPTAGSSVTIKYQKSAETLYATDRVLSYYTATSGMVGLDLGQLMLGIDFPGVQVGGQYEGQGFANQYGGTYADSLINGGGFNNGVITNASGYRPEDIVIDGEYGFLSPYSGHAPEEVVPGFAIDSLGVSVFTKTRSRLPAIFTGNIDVASSPNKQVFTLPVLPTTIPSLSLILNGRVLEYTTNTRLNYGDELYNLNWTTAEITIPPQSAPGKLGFTIIEVGGGTGTGYGIIDKEVSYSFGSAIGGVESVAGPELVLDAFVTVNGVPVSTTSTGGAMWFKLEVGETGKSVAVVRNLDTTVMNAIQAWFINESQETYNEIREERFTVGAEGTNTFVLSYPPADVGPLSAQTIIEITDDLGTRRLLPPDVDYYAVEDTGNFTYSINAIGSTPSNVSTSNVKVYINGIETTEFTCLGRTVILNSSTIVLEEGNTIAIEAFVPEVIGTDNTLTNYAYDYRVDGSVLYLAPGVQSNTSTVTSATIKVITFTDHDHLLMEREEIAGDINRQFQISRPAINDNYVWVTLYKSTGVDTPPESYGLINGIDFIILEDNITIQISDSWSITSDDIVEVISFSGADYSGSAVGYRIFNDMLGGTTFTRLGGKHTTTLTRPLANTDTEIHVKDAYRLTQPNVGMNIPGVVLIAGERIEFFQATGTVLSQLRRGTMGTGPATYLEIGTKVYDQGTDQIIPNPESTLIQNTFTSAGVIAYEISKVSTEVTFPGSTSTMISDGITLSTDKSIAAINQLEVYYGGRQLRKAGIYKHDTSVVFDNVPINGGFSSVPNLDSLPTSTFEGACYLVTDTNKVWTYTGVRSDSTATIGYVDSGLRFLPPEYTVEDGTQQILRLNTTVEEGIQLTIVKKEFNTVNDFNTIITNTSTVGIVDSTTPVAEFLREDPVDLPNDYYYGGDYVLRNEVSAPLTEENGRNLTGYY